MKREDLLAYSQEVAQARSRNQAVVALESTIISHGMPWPQNLETARELEAIVRQNGAIPATIAVLKGKIQVGLERDQLEQLAKDPQVQKVSRRDLPLVLASGQPGATTVAATMICAQMAGIKLFATGGIGGVHRGGEDSMDVSADLTELAQSNVAVVCAGAKAILDIGRTLEYLETHGVPVIGYGTAAFPAFYTRESGFLANARMDQPQEVAKMLAIKWSLGLNGGVIIGNPVPEQDALEASICEDAIQKALAEAEAAQISGKRVTPFLLRRIKELTAGDSLVTNIALVRNNAAVAAQIAVCLQQL